ncbi:hypothetical protein RE428_25130 [Marinobacter nanhaiticus D15-8W]|uniref:Uncharacterized protein n=1 Tax=Marinobacter nanhaiticus D15-8W TaxID=626887 RepID=N6WZC1_9GAMM|nr:hypothetical protein [Marinobacter nanhaiticus]ENO14113.2 hypothetical protein J057_22005 [Marinobacter nanhaiticus D15-8W]BES71495.1 hypothetical protein RE428_25130 [Marinobacter nanhaiticus D15-8W]
MKIDIPASIQIPQKLFDNGQARVTTDEANTSEEMADHVTSAIYHKNEPVVPSTYGNQQVKGFHASYIEAPDAMMARTGKVIGIFTTGIGERSVELETSYIIALDELSSVLREKDWGFSVQGGKLKVMEGSDSLSEKELQLITNALEEAGVNTAAHHVANAVIEMIQTDRGPDGLSRGIGQYDVNISNFAEVVDLRRHIEEHQPSGKFGKGLVNPNNVESRYYLSGIGIMDQVAVKADKSFLAPHR